MSNPSRNKQTNQTKIRNINKLTTGKFSEYLIRNKDEKQTEQIHDDKAEAET